jgi:hypothetical protein
MRDQVPLNRKSAAFPERAPGGLDRGWGKDPGKFFPKIPAAIHCNRVLKESLLLSIDSKMWRRWFRQGSWQ